MPNLSWWTDEQIDEYLDAFRELLLPQTSVLVGNHSTLWRWLLPDWKSDRNPTARDIARAASEMGKPTKSSTFFFMEAMPGLGKSVPPRGVRPRQSMAASGHSFGAPDDCTAHEGPPA